MGSSEAGSLCSILERSSSILWGGGSLDERTGYGIVGRVPKECVCVCVSSTFISHIECENLAPLLHGNVLCEPVSIGMQNVPVNRMYTQTWV